MFGIIFIFWYYICLFGIAVVALCDSGTESKSR